MSSLAHYIAFFETSSWGIDRRRLNLGEVRRLRVPDLSEAQIRELSELHRQLARLEATARSRLFEQDENSQDAIDEAVFGMLRIHRAEALLASDFYRVRLQLDKGKTRTDATEPPDDTALRAYAHCLRDELDRYAGLYHRVSVIRDADLIACEVQVTESRDHIEPVVASQGGTAVHDYQTLWAAIRERRSQWVYVQRGLRIFDGSRAVLCKAARRINWTRSQALHDSDDIISEVLDAVSVES
jgi:hypothetical protein